MNEPHHHIVIALVDREEDWRLDALELASLDGANRVSGSLREEVRRTPRRALRKWTRRQVRRLHRSHAV